MTIKKKGSVFLWIGGLILGLALWGPWGFKSLAAEAESADGTLDGLLDYGQIQSVINDADGDPSISFSQIVASLFNGDLTMTFEGIGQYIYDHIFSEIDANRKSILQIIGIAVLGAVFTNFSVAFAKNYVARTGFYMTYLILFSLLLTAFLAAFSVAGSVLDFLVEFMSALLPAFCTAIAFAAGTASAAGFYGVTALAIAAVDWLICHGLLGLIQTYMILSLVNEISQEDRLSRLCGLIRTVISWSLKTMLGLTLGLNIIQGMVLPAFDSFKNSAFMKLSSIIPGIGKKCNRRGRAHRYCGDLRGPFDQAPCDHFNV